jgi:hypothetical protein
VDLVVLVRDSAGAPIANAEVTLIASTRTTSRSDQQGKCIPAALPTKQFQIEVSHPQYLDETTEVTPPSPGGAFVWDNPVCSIIQPATIVISLSRLRAAKNFPISNSDLERRNEFNPQAAFTWIDKTGNPTGRYLGIFNDDKAIMPVSHPFLPVKPTDGWGRINHSNPIQINPSQLGDFAYLEWGLGGNEPRLLLGVWVPRFVETPSYLNFIIFFTPITASYLGYPADQFPWLGSYPYLASKVKPVQEGPSPLQQRYVGLGFRYLFPEKLLLYQLLASKHQAVVVIPIQPSADWGPFTYAPALARLVTEITHYLHRTGKTSGGQTNTGPDVAPVSPRYRVGRTRIQLAPPPLQRVVLSGFSAGVGPIAQMLPTTIGQRFDESRFNQGGLSAHALFGADVAPFLDAWMEVWDHDAPKGVLDQIDQFLPAWLDQNSKRIGRCYQSQYTTPQDWIQKTPLGKYAPNILPTASVASTYAIERHGDRASLMYFASNYLVHSSVSPAIAPVFWGAATDHQSVPMVTFGHAAVVSGLDKRK